MKLNFKQIVESIRGDGSVCDRYRGTILSASTKSALMEAVTSADGVEFLTRRLSDDIHMDYDTVSRELAQHINGSRTFSQGSGYGYTSEIYIGYTGDVESRTSVLALWGCRVHLSVPDNRSVSVFCDACTHLDVETGNGSRVVCVYYGEMPECSGFGTIRYIKGK